MLMRRIELGKDRGQGRIDQQLGGSQLLMKVLLLLMQGLPLILGGAVALTLESLELLLQVVLRCFEAPIGGDDRVMSLFQLGHLVCGQDGTMMMPSASRAGGSGGRVGGLGKGRRDACGSQREGQ